MECRFYPHLDFENGYLRRPIVNIVGFVKTNDFDTFTFKSTADLRNYPYFSTVQSIDEIYKIQEIVKYGELYVVKANYFCVANDGQYTKAGYIDRNPCYNRLSYKDIFNALGTQSKEMSRLVPTNYTPYYTACIVLEYQGTSIPSVRFADSTSDVTLPSQGFIKQYKYGESQDRNYTSNATSSCYLLIPFYEDGRTYTLWDRDDADKKIATNSMKQIVSTLNKMRSDLLKSIRVTYIQSTAFQTFNTAGTYLDESYYKQGGICVSKSSVCFKEGYTASDKPSSDFCGMVWCNYNPTQISGSSTRLNLVGFDIATTYFIYNNASIPLKINVLGTEMPVFVIKDQYIGFEPHLDYIGYVVNDQYDIDKVNNDITFSYSELDNYRAYKYGNMDAELASEQAYNRKNFVANLGLDIVGASTKIGYNTVKQAKSNREYYYNAPLDTSEDIATYSNNVINGRKALKGNVANGVTTVAGTALFSIAKNALENHMASKRLESQKSSIAMQTYTNNIVQGSINFHEILPISVLCFKPNAEQTGALYNYCVENNIISIRNDPDGINASDATIYVLYKRTRKFFTPYTLTVHASYTPTVTPSIQLDAPEIEKEVL